MENFYITTPIYYVNANPHLGHAYTTIVADSLTRMHKMLGDNTLFLTGTDEHGDKIVQAAEKRDLSPRQFADEISSHFKALWPGLSVDNDYFTRTTDRGHIRTVQDFLQRVHDAGDIYYGEFGGFYCYGCERFYTEKELENGLCPQHQTKPLFINEKNYFFRMSKYLPWLKEYIETHADFIRPERYRREALAMLEDGVLEDLCISRPKSRLEWGIELPFDKNYVCYVWFDALLCYINGIGWPDGNDYKKFWPGEHLIAKDILKPHAIFWPCMLKSAGLPVYRHLDVHGYWLVRDTKMSKSLGNVIDPLEMRDHFGLDAFRYFLLKDMHFGSDSSFSEEAIVTRINADLANDLGNLFSRVLSMNAKYFDSMMPEVGMLNEDDKIIMDLCSTSLANYNQLFIALRFAEALESLWIFVRALNKYVDSQAPWSLFKNGDTKRLGTCMAVLLASMRKIAISLWAVMPDVSEIMRQQLGMEVEKGLPPTNNFAGEAKEFAFPVSGTKMASASNLFPRIDTKQTKNTDKKEKDRKDPKNESPEKISTVKIDAFQILDIRTGTVLKAEKHPNADKILCLEIDFAEEKPRQILSGLAEFYKPEELAGRKVCAILNLEPRKIRGLVSHGMVLTADDGKNVTLLEPDASMANGAKIM